MKDILIDERESNNEKSRDYGKHQNSAIGNFVDLNKKDKIIYN